LGNAGGVRTALVNYKFRIVREALIYVLLNKEEKWIGNDKAKRGFWIWVFWQVYSIVDGHIRVPTNLLIVKISSGVVNLILGFSSLNDSITNLLFFGRNSRM